MLLFTAAPRLCLEKKPADIVEYVTHVVVLGFMPIIGCMISATLPDMTAHQLSLHCYRGLLSSVLLFPHGDSCLQATVRSNCEAGSPPGIVG